MNRDALAAVILFGLAAFLWSRQSQASSSPSSIAPSRDLWTLLNTVNDEAAKAIQDAQDIVEEMTVPELPPEPVTSTDPATGQPAFTNPIPPIPAM